MTLEGAMHANSFYIYIKDYLLENLSTGDIVIMDNLSSHKSQGVLERIENVAARVAFLPTHSPDLYPIELIWSEVKSILRKLQTRNPQDLVKTTGTALNKVTSYQPLRPIAIGLIRPMLHHPSKDPSDPSDQPDLFILTGH